MITHLAHARIRHASIPLAGTILAALAFAACSASAPPGDASVHDVMPEAGASEAALDANGEADAPAPSAPPSCESLATTCGGPSGNKDCCASTLVPGGTFFRSEKAQDPATVSPFRLDVYEVTVGRFRAFVLSGEGTQAHPPVAGAGAHPLIPGSGWDPAFNAKLSKDTAALRAALSCNAEYPAWTDAPKGNETRAMNCLSWYDSFAFCAWDGGRLPTEAEWGYAGWGGSEQRPYPWGSELNNTKASYDCASDGTAVNQCAFTDLFPVGSFSPQGDARWGQADMGGTVFEWNLDWAAPYSGECHDCANLNRPSNLMWRSTRGGGFILSATYLPAAASDGISPGSRYSDGGVRCARNP
jgi:sulfatase modifying factor 1